VEWGRLRRPWWAGAKRQGNRTQGDPRVPTLLPCHPRPYEANPLPCSFHKIPTLERAMGISQPAPSSAIRMHDFILIDCAQLQPAEHKERLPQNKPVIEDLRNPQGLLRNSGWPKQIHECCYYHNANGYLKEDGTEA
jgi:hypothetical protein